MQLSKQALRELRNHSNVLIAASSDIFDANALNPLNKGRIGDVADIITAAAVAITIIGGVAIVAGARGVGVVAEAVATVVEEVVVTVTVLDTIEEDILHQHILDNLIIINSKARVMGVQGTRLYST